MADAFERAQTAIVEIGAKLAGSVQQLRERGAHPSSVEVEFGLKFTAKGGLVVNPGQRGGVPHRDDHLRP